MSQSNERKRLPTSYYDDGSRKRQSRSIDSDQEDMYPPGQVAGGRNYSNREYDDDDGNNRNRFISGQRPAQQDRRKIMGGTENEDDFEFQGRNRGRYVNDRPQERPQERPQDRNYRGGDDDDEDDPPMFTGRRQHQVQRDSDGRYGSVNEDRGSNVHRGRPQYSSDNDDDHARYNSRGNDGGFRQSNPSFGSRGNRNMNNDDDDDSYNNSRPYGGNQRRPEQSRSQHGNDHSNAGNAFGKYDNSGFKRGDADYRERQRINLDKNNSMGTKKMIGSYDDYYNPNMKGNPNRNVDSRSNFSRGNRNNASYDSDNDNRYRGSSNSNVGNRNSNIPQRDDNYDSDPDVDPFPNALRCKPIDMSPEININYQTVEWYSPDAPIPIEMEEAIIPTLVQYGARERGTFVFQTMKRLQNVKNILLKVNNTRMRREQSLQNPPKMDLMQALSLRRHHMKQMNPNLSMTQLHLGLEQNIQRSAQLFEKSMEDFLVQNYVSYYNEQQQKQHILQNKKENEPYPPTPDFVLKDPIRVCTYVYGTEPASAADANDDPENPEPPSQPIVSKIVLNQKVIRCKL